MDREEVAFHGNKDLPRLILKVPGSSIRQTYGLMQLRDVCCICKETGYISTEYFDVNK